MKFMKLAILAIALIGAQQVAQAQCTMGGDTGCGSDMRDEITAYAQCVISNFPAPPNYNNPNCGNSYSYNFYYYVDGDGDVDLSSLETPIYNWLYNIFGGQAGGRRISMTLSCNERAWNFGTLYVSIDCN